MGFVESTDPAAQPDPREATDHEKTVMNQWAREGRINGEGTALSTEDLVEGALPASDPVVRAVERKYSMGMTDSGLVVPGAEEEDKDGIGIMSKIAAVGTVTGAATGIGGVMAEEAKGVPVDGGNKPAAIERSANHNEASASSDGPTATMSSTYHWENLGGDPLFANGADNEKEFIENITSPKGKLTLKRLGFSPDERKALLEAARSGDATNCRTTVGERFTKMSYGSPEPIVVSDVVFADQDFADGGAPAWCLKAKVPIGKNGAYKIVKLEAPEDCSNFAPKPSKIVVPKRKKPRTGRLDLVKAFEDANGNPIHVSGQEFKASCVVRGIGRNGKGKRVTNRFEYNPDRRRGPATALRGCKVGSVATMMEITPPGHSAHWDVLTGKPVVRDGRVVGFVQKQRVDRGRNLFGFKNVQKRPGQPNPPPDVQPKFGPDVDVVGWQHILAGDEQLACAYERIGSAAIAQRNFSEQGSGEFVGFIRPGDEAGEWCIPYKAGTESGNASITYTAEDTNGLSDSDTEHFPTIGNDDPRGQF
jgi:hypothetical protein